MQQLMESMKCLKQALMFTEVRATFTDDTMEAAALRTLHFAFKRSQEVIKDLERDNARLVLRNKLLGKQLDELDSQCKADLNRVLWNPARPKAVTRG